jgi:hypothetical protein|tara:strand:+ start:1289 stop:1429 length:141 start_codon:yes stop_codon:yes gene_type:complete
MSLHQNNIGKYVVCDKNGKVVIITHHKRIAEACAKRVAEDEKRSDA